MHKIYFGGCSITMGAGFDQVQLDPRIYPNLIHGDIVAINDAEGGSSNLKIFIKAAKSIIECQADVYVVQWSAVHRHWLYPAPNRGIYIGSPVDVGQNSDFVKQFQELNHDYPNLMTVIDYCRILTTLTECCSSSIIFVNGMLHWKADWADNYMKNLLQGLSQEEQQDFIQRFNNNIELMDIDRWVNIYESIVEMQTDDAPLDHHPGPRTHAKIAAKINTMLDKLREGL